jgi:leader peptidase (prepilin peptidase)/N-methyltransferase
LDPFLAAAIFLAGLAFGSFLNVCISRIPRDLSIIQPRSSCPHCKTPIHFRDNVPLLSWVRLRGRCRDCRHPISWRYPAVELLTALLFVACYAAFGLTGQGAKTCLFCFLTLGLIFMDAETGLLPREFTYSGTGLGLLFAWFVSGDFSATEFLSHVFGCRVTMTDRGLSLLDAVLASVFAAGFFYLAWALYYLVRKREGIGIGDIAFAAMIGAFLGLKLAVLAVFLAPVLGTIYAAILLFTHRGTATHEPGGLRSGSGSTEELLRQEVPFGVFLGVSALFALFFGQHAWSFYLGLFR